MSSFEKAVKVTLLRAVAGAGYGAFLLVAVVFGGAAKLLGDPFLRELDEREREREREREWLVEVLSRKG
jgi:hypothetical protein